MNSTDDGGWQPEFSLPNQLSRIINREILIIVCGFRKRCKTNV